MSTSGAEVAVIGLGAIGSMTLWRLTERGVTVHGYERFGIAHDRGASAGQTRRFSVQNQREPRLTPLAVEALGLWNEPGEHTERELLRLTGGVILGPGALRRSSLRTRPPGTPAFLTRCSMLPPSARASRSTSCAPVTSA